MLYGRIDGIDLPVSRLVMGTATGKILPADTPEATEEQRQTAFEALDNGIAVGINTFDCAAIYGEYILGEWMRERGNRKDVVILSKCAHPNAFRHRLHDYDILSDLSDSLAKLGTDHVDLYLLHRDVHEVKVSEIIDVLNRLYEEGKVKAFGVSNWRAERIEEANEYAAKHGLCPFTVSSPHFSLAEQITDPYAAAGYTDGCIGISGPSGRGEREYYKKSGMPVFAYSSLACGFFSGKFRAGDREGTEKYLNGFARLGYLSDDNVERLRRAERMAEQKNTTVAKIAMAYIFRRNMNMFAVTGASGIAHLNENVDALENLPMTTEEAAWLDLEI